jgi:type I site-specific restriction endonuclease
MAGFPEGLPRASTPTPKAEIRSMNEAATRAEHIDPALKAAGWGVVEDSRIRREYPITPGRIEGHGRRGKALTADYVLGYRCTEDSAGSFGRA